MNNRYSRRDVMRAGAASVLITGVGTPVLAPAATAGAKEDLFYREDWFGEPWRKPETAVLIHGT